MLRSLVGTLALWLALAGAARAEVSEIRISQQYGTSILPLLVMERDKLIEKHAAAAGLGDVKATWMRFAGPAVSNDALLSGTLDVAVNGAPTVLLLWDKTRGEIRGLASISSNPSILVTRNPAVRTVGDFSEKDKIAVPSVGIGLNAILLQMAAEKAFGATEWRRLDSRMITMGHPDALAAMLSGKTEITAHFSNPPYSTTELREGGREVMRAKDVLGGGWDMIVTMSRKFHDANPKTCAALLAALSDAIGRINADKRAAAALYLEMSGDRKSTVDEILAIIDDPDTVYSLSPTTTMRFADFMQRVGIIKSKPASWQDVFFPEAATRPGN